VKHAAICRGDAGRGAARGGGGGKAAAQDGRPRGTWGTPLPLRPLPQQVQQEQQQRRPGSPPPPHAVAASPFGAGAPLALLCFVCGRGFGTASLLIHVPQCERLAADRARAAGAAGPAAAPGPAAASPPGTPPRPAPPPPPRPAALAAPLPRDAAGVDAFNREMAAIWEAAALARCAHCGRTFLPDALARHARHCTAARPMKRAPAAAAARAAAPA
jgi:hypothetical protein